MKLLRWFENFLTPDMALIIHPREIQLHLQEWLLLSFLSHGCAKDVPVLHVSDNS